MDVLSEENLSPDELKLLMELGGLSEEQQLIMKQREQAELMRNAPIPKGGMAGRVYVADPLGALAAGYERYQGHKGMKKADQRYMDTVGKQTNARSIYAELLRGRRGLPAMSPPGLQPSGVETFAIPESTDR